MKDRLAALVKARWVIVGLGLVFIIGGSAAALYEATRPESSPIMRFPTAIAASDSGELFVFSEWSRIRVFSPNGDQIRSWRVDTDSGMAVLAFEQPGVLAVATARNDRLYRFTLMGELISSDHDPTALDRIGTRGRKRTVGTDGRRYQISDMSVTSTDQAGKRIVVVPGVPALLRPFFFANLPPIVFAVQGTVLLALGAALVAQKSQFERKVAAQQGVADGPSTAGFN